MRDSVIDKKIDALDSHVSQFYEWLPWIGHYSQEVPAGHAERIKWMSKREDIPITPEVRKALQKWYGQDAGTAVQHAEAFEICEYGAQPNPDQIRRLFPMLPKN